MDSKLRDYFVLPSGMFHETPYIYFLPGGRFLDIGASQGVYAMPAARFSSYVLAVEADPEQFHLMERAVHDRHLSIDMMNVAISDVPGGTVKGITKVEVPITTIDQLWDSKGPFDSIKIDIEGDEERAILGASKALSAGCVFSVEVHSSHPDSFCSLLLSKGCDVYLIDQRNYPKGTEIHYIVAFLPSNTPKPTS